MSIARILVVDDHPIICDGLEMYLSKEPGLRIKWKAHDSKTALELCHRHRPDLAIVDIALGRESGTELMAALLAIHPALAIIGLSIHEEMRYVAGALAAGARGYISKGMASRKLAEAIREVLAGRNYVLVSSGGGGAAAGEAHVVEPDIAVLSPREREVFGLIGEGRTRFEIARTLGLSANTVENQRASIRKKLNLSSIKELERRAFLASDAT